jgi:hypothetical protein
MKNLFCLKLFIMFVFINGGNAFADLHIVFDLDWTLIYATRENSENVADIVLSKDESYKFSDGTAEIIEYLSQIPGVKISFFSGGPAERNKKVLQGLILPSGQSALDIAHKVLSKDDLDRRAGVPDTSNFSLRFRKNPAKISNEVRNVIIVEDSPQFVDSIHLDSVVWTGNPFEYVDRKELINSPELRARSIYLPKNLLEWQRERTKLVWCFGVVQKLIEMVNQGEATDLANASRIIFGKSGDAYSKPNPSTEIYNYFLQEGFKKINSKYPNFKVLQSFVDNTNRLKSLTACERFVF